MDTKDMDTPEHEPNIVADAPPVASSKKEEGDLGGMRILCAALLCLCRHRAADGC